MQHGKVVAYASRQLRIHVQNYAIDDLELTTVVFALKLRHHYLRDMKFEVFNDHKNLKYILTQSDLNLSQRHLMKYMKDYDFELSYHLGKANAVVDALSQKSNDGLT